MQRRKSRLHCTQTRYAVPRQVKQHRGQRPQSHHHDGHGEFGPQPLGCQQDHQRRRPQPQRQGMDLHSGQMPHQLRQLTGAGGAAHELGQLHQNDGAADAADESPHHGGRYEPQHPPRPQQGKQQQPYPHVEGQNRHHPLRLGGAHGDAHASQHAADHGRRGGIHAEDELRRRRQQRKQDHRQQ